MWSLLSNPNIKAILNKLLLHLEILEREAFNLCWAVISSMMLLYGNFPVSKYKGLLLKILKAD